MSSTEHISILIIYILGFIICTIGLIYIILRLLFNIFDILNKYVKVFKGLKEYVVYREMFLEWFEVNKETETDDDGEQYINPYALLKLGFEQISDYPKAHFKIEDISVYIDAKLKCGDSEYCTVYYKHSVMLNIQTLKQLISLYSEKYPFVSK